uniref:FANCI_S4 domain-containing protein n=1 Tax=Angiostrongylus cantonensis TaxID=6313 RepID=A0A0K0D1H2_ANGCA
MERFSLGLALGKLTRDLDDSVRLTAVLCIIETAKKKLEAVNESLILACCDRMKDKKPKIRQEVIAKLLHLYFKVIMGDEFTASETAAVTVIPEKALALYMLASMTEEKWSMIERYFSSYIIPYKMGIKKRIKSMVDLFCKLDKFESQVFAEIVARSSCHRRILREMLDIISRQGSSEDKAQLESKIQRISSTYHDSNGKELIRRSAEVGTIPKDCQTNIRRYIERVAPLIMDQESTNELLRLLVHLKNDVECGNNDAITKLPRLLRLMKDIEERVSLDNPAACINALQVISEFHRNLPHEFGCRVKALITDFIVPGLVLSPETDDDAAESHDPLIPLEERPVSQYCLPKVYGMKLLARYLFACNGDVENDALASKTIKMFAAFIQAAGDLHDPNKHISLTEKAWLRAVAGVSLLKLCYVQKYSQMVDAGMFVTLANLMTDTADCVRNYFVKRLNKGIMRNRLTIEYLSFFSLVNLVNATEVEENAVKNYRDQCRAFLLSAITRRRHLIQSSGFSSVISVFDVFNFLIVMD